MSRSRATLAAPAAKVPRVLEGGNTNPPVQEDRPGREQTRCAADNCIRPLAQPHGAGRDRRRVRTRHARRTTSIQLRRERRPISVHRKRSTRPVWLVFCCGTLETQPFRPPTRAGRKPPRMVPPQRGKDEVQRGQMAFPRRLHVPRHCWPESRRKPMAPRGPQLEPDPAVGCVFLIK